MDPAVGPAGGGHAYRSGRDRGERALQRILHRAAARLGLPAEEAAAVVFES
jgi:hypothetical protein